MYNGRPLGRKKTVQCLVLLTLLAWATQTLFHQWGYGQVAGEPERALPQLSAEKFVPGTARFAAGATLELRGEATVIGAEVRLRQVCRWSDQDAAVFAPVKDLVLFRLDRKRPYRALDVEELKNTLHDAGVNLAVIKISGPLSCMVSRSDVHVDEQAALDQWIAARQGGQTTSDPSDNPPLPAAPRALPATRPAVMQAMAIPAGDRQLPAASAAAPVAAGPADSPIRTLRTRLLQDLSERLSLPLDSLQVRFNPQDEKVLNLAEPQFQFQVEARRVHNLGSVAWDVTIVAGGPGGTRKVTIGATARAWQQQVVVMKPLAYKQVIRAEDLLSRRTLVDHLEDEVLLSADQIVGQQAGLQLKPGTIVTARMIEAVPLVRNGQLVTVILSRGAVEVKTVGRAMEPGAYGQTIRVRNETTRDIYEVVVTGPQTARLGPNTPSMPNSDPLASVKD
jgi:flagella basal body P-ring formation protein FlgA